MIRQLEQILGEKPEHASQRAKHALDEVSAEKSAYVLVGSGMLGKKVLSGMRRNGRNVLAFVDSAPQKWGSHEAGIPVLSPAEAGRRYGKSAIFIVTIWAPRHRYLTTKARLHKFGIESVIPFQAALWAYPADLLPHYQFALPRFYLEQAEALLHVINGLEDDESRNLFARQLAWRLTLDYAFLPDPTPDDQYFPEEIIPSNDREVFVDGGAFDGDTIKSFLYRRCEQFSAIHAFEPDPNNFGKLSNFLGSLGPALSQKIFAHAFAVGAESKSVRFDAPGATRAAISETGSAEVRCVALDDTLVDQPISFLKLDVEGSELEALRGARQLICRHRPIVAVCLYHRPDDLVAIPSQLSEYCPDYRFHFRCHDEDGLELVYYAVPRERG